MWPEKIAKVCKSYPKIISHKNYVFYKNCLRMWEIWENKLLAKALKICPSPINRRIWSHWHILPSCQMAFQAKRRQFSVFTFRDIFKARPFLRIFFVLSSWSSLKIISNSVTTFGENSPLWHKLKCLGQIWRKLLLTWESFIYNLIKELPRSLWVW